VPAGTLTLTAGSDLVTCSVPVTVAVGQQLHVPGAANPANRKIARRVTEVVSGSSFRVEFTFPASEAIVASPVETPVLKRRWQIMKSRETYAPAGMLAAANETTGTFRDGTPGYTVGAG
jgi:hypothetical protein